MDAVHTLVLQNGWATTSLGQVAEMAGISRQTIYNLFGSRTSLVQAYIMFRLDEVLTQVDVIFTTTDDVEASLRRSVALFLEVFDSSIVDTVAANGANVEDLIPILTVTNEVATTHLAQLISRQAPALSDDEAIIYADAIARLALTHALAPTIPHDEAVERVTRVALRMLGWNR